MHIFMTVLLVRPIPIFQEIENRKNALSETSINLATKFWKWLMLIFVDLQDELIWFWFLFLCTSEKKNMNRNSDNAGRDIDLKRQNIFIYLNKGMTYFRDEYCEYLSSNYLHLTFFFFQTSANIYSQYTITAVIISITFSEDNSPRKKP